MPEYRVEVHANLTNILGWDSVIWWEEFGDPTGKGHFWLGVWGVLDLTVYIHGAEKFEA